jgi:signal transduction histidine kinase
VVFALGLAAVGMIYAVQQVRMLTVRLEAQAQAQVASAAERIRRQFAQEHSAGIQAALRCADHSAGAPCYAESLTPSWFNAAYRWTGHELAPLLQPKNAIPSLEPRITALLSARPVGSPQAQQTWQRGEIYQDAAAEPPIALSLAETSDLTGSPVLVVTNVDLAKLRSDLVEPLLSPDMGLEMGQADGHPSRWSQPLFGVLHSWVLRPTSESIREQRRIMFGQTVVYLALTLLAVGTLLAAMWVLMRVLRREIALAEMKANFVADVSHELKTPLALIRMFGETLQSGRVKDDAKRNEYYEIITRESTRLTNLIDNILDFAKINAGQKTYAFEPTDVAAVVRQTFESYRPQLEHNGFEPRLTVQGSLPEVDADPDAIAQALINLLQNAMKYSGDERYVAVDVSGDVRRDRRGVLVSVHDRGIGIRPEDRRHVLEGFFRARDGRVAKQGGAGLGLALVKHIVDAHGGTLDVESRLVKGSTFRIFLPAAKRRPDTGDVPAPEGAKQT